MLAWGWIFLGAAGCWAAYRLWDRFVRVADGDGQGGFWDFVKNPDALKQPRPPPPGQAFPLPVGDAPEAWDACLRAAIGHQWDVFEYYRLAQRSPLLSSAAVRLMRDAAFVGQAWPIRNSLPYWNLSALERLLGQVVPLEVLPHVEPFLLHADEWCRNTAAHILGRIDHADAAATMRRCIRTEDRRLRDGLFQGMANTVHERPGCHRLIVELWSDLVEALVAGRVNYSSVPTLIRRLAGADRQRACADLHRDALLRWDHGELADILEGLGAVGIPPSRDVIVALIARWHGEAASEGNAFRRGRILGACLGLLAGAQAAEADEETKALVLGLLDDPSGDTRRSACPAFLRLNGISTDPAHICHDILHRQHGLLSPPQRAYAAVHDLLAEVQNGGWHQYFVNPSGNGWKDCMTGAEEMGLRQVVADLARAARLFGTDGPEVNRDRRWQQLARFTKHQDQVLEDLGIDGNAVEVALARYAVRHRSEFLPVLAPPPEPS
jgi:hypothetical protein